MADTFASALPADDPSVTGLVEVLLDISLTGTMLLRPHYAADGTTIQDFAWVRLNPAAQRMLHLPERPAESFLTQFPTATEVGVFAFYCDAFLSGRTAPRQNLYQHDGLDGYYVLVARRHAGVLVVGFTDGNDQFRSAAEQALHERQAHEAAARAEAETQQTTLQHVLEQIPVAIGILDGPDYTVTFANADMALLWGRPLPQIIGRPHFTALPDLAGQGFEAIFAEVYRTGQPYYLREQLVQLDRAGTGQLIPGYFHIVYQARRDTQGCIVGLIASATEVTDQVLARQQVQRLNDELEARVARRTAEAQAALHEVQHQGEQLLEQQSLLRQILKQVPAAVATLTGPEHRFQFFNDQYLALSAGRVVLEESVAQVFPEVVDQGFIELLDQVYATGQPLVGTDTPVQLLDRATGQLDQRYADFIYQPLHDGQGEMQGILAFILDTTDAVRARRQNEALQAQVLAAAHRRVQEQEELYQIFEQAPVAIVLLREPDHCIEYFNPAFETLFPPDGWTGAIQGHTIAEVYPRLKLVGLVALLDRVFSTGETQVVIEMPLAELQPGSPRYVTFSYQAYREQGRIVGVAAFAYDVTEQVLARRQADAMQAALLAAAQRRAQERQDLLHLFERAPVAVALLREPDHRIEYHNSLFAELYPGRQLLGCTIAEAYPDAVTPAIVSRLDRVYQTGETYQGSEVLLTGASPGAPRYITFTYQAYHEHDRVAGVAIFIHEVTEQVLARRQGEVQQQLVQTVFDQSPTAIFVLRGPSYILEIVNPLMEQMLGYPRAALLGRPYFEAVPELANQGYPDLMRQVWETGEALTVQDQPAQLSYHRAADTGYFSFVYQPLRDEPQGPVTGIACVAVDVTTQVVARQQVQTLNEELAAINEEMQATNEELNDANTRLTRTNADLDTFVYSASHDLKSPITNIEGLLLALREQLPPAALQVELVPRLLGMMDGAVARFQETLGYLTDVSRLQQTVLDQPAEAVNLPALVEAVRLDILPELTAAGAALTVDVAACPTLYFAAKNLRSILYNLLSNAVKYQAPDRPPLVQLRCRRTEAGQVVLEVQDNGLGLNEQQQGELFRLFRRLHSHVAGSGVGLYVTKKMVENVGGTLTVHSQPGSGSTFTVTLPAPGRSSID